MNTSTRAVLSRLLTLYVYITVSNLTMADPFHCDEDIISDVRPLSSYMYTCDGVPQCIDRRDEAGCLHCTSERLLLTGLDPSSNLFQYETTYEKQYYKLRNRAVYKTSEGSLRKGYITYNDLQDRWELSEHADSGIVLVSSPTTFTEPFVTGISWRLPEKAEMLPNVGLECVSSEIRKCYGDVVVVSPTNVFKLVLSEEEHYLNYRPVYANKDHVLQYVLTSDSWDTPHWQITNIGTEEEEVMVFLGTAALYPEYANTPGLYRSTGGTWIKSSNAYVTCEVLRSEKPHLIDCLFETSTCGWETRGPGDSALPQGAAEQFSLGYRLAPSFYITADRGTTPGKYKLTSPDFDVDTESCLLVKLASTVRSADSGSTVTINIQDLYSTDVIYEMEKCTNKDRSDCSKIESYKTEKISLTLADGIRKENAKIVVTIRMELNEQPSGVVSLAEIALLNEPCDSVDLRYMNMCFDYDLDFPCDSNTCRNAGLRGYQCECKSSTNYGPHCDAEQTSCFTDMEREADNVETITLLKGYRGYDVMFFTCEDGFELNGDNPRCERDGGYSANPSCVEVECPVLDVPHATTTSALPTVTVQCDSGFHPTAPQTVECVKGEYTSLPSPCLLHCPYPADTTPVSDSTSTISVDVETCEYATNNVTTNYTNCVIVSDRTRVPGSVSVAPDISVSVSGEGKLCVRFGNSTSGGVECEEKCVVSGVLKLVRVVEDRPQFIEVVTDFDYSKEALINGFGFNASVSLSTLIIGFLVMILT